MCISVHTGSVFVRVQIRVILYKALRSLYWCVRGRNNTCSGANRKGTNNCTCT